MRMARVTWKRNRWRFGISGALYPGPARCAWVDPSPLRLIRHNRWVGRIRLLSLLAVMFCSLLACGADVVIHPPDQSERYVSTSPPPLESFVAMDAPDAARSIVSGVGEEVVDGHRWAEQRAVLRFHSIPLGDLRFHAVIVLPERLMKQAGTVTIKVLFDGETAHQAEYTEPGSHEIEKKLAQGEVSWERATEVTLDMVVPEGRWVADADARYLLAAAGFRF